MSARGVWCNRPNVAVRVVAFSRVRRALLCSVADSLSPKVALQRGLASKRALACFAATSSTSLSSEYVLAKHAVEMANDALYETEWGSYVRGVTRDGDLDAMVEELEVSKRGLQRRMTQLGLG